MRALLTATLLPLLVVLSLPGRAAADTLHVPQQHTTIQAAVDAANDGDTIQIQSGTYSEAVLVSGKTGLLIVGSGKVVIDPPDGQTGLTLQGCAACTVERISVLGGQPYGIHLDGCTGGTLLKCRLDTSSDDGIRLDDCLDVFVKACTVTDAGGDGIALAVGDATPTTHCTLIGNKIFSAGGDAVGVNGTLNVVIDNVGHKPLGNGFAVDVATEGAQNVFVGNRVVNPGSVGLVVTGVDSTVAQNRVIGSGDNAVSVSGSGHFVGGNRLVKAGFDGVACSTQAIDVTLDGNVISKPGDDGIDVQGAGAIVIVNRVTAAGDNGFEIEAADGHYQKNSALGSKNDGFELGAGTAGNGLYENKAKGSKGFDLNDQSGGANTVDDGNTFKTENP